MSECKIDLQKTFVNKLRNINSVQEVLDIMHFVLGKDYTVDRAEKEFNPTLYKRLHTLLESFNYNFTKPEEKQDVQIINKKISNISSIFNSPLITDLFDTFHVAENYFNRQVNSKIIEAILLNPEFDFKGEPIKKYVTSSAEISTNIKILKNKLFKEIVDYLNSKGVIDKSKYYDNDVFIGRLYDVKGNFQNYDLYVETIRLLEKTLSGDNEENLLETSFNKKIINLKGNTRLLNDRLKLDAYNAAVLLVNFDNVIAKKFSNVINLNYSVFNNFEDPAAGIKYQLMLKGKSVEYWKNEEHMSESVEEIVTDMVKSLVESIPHVNKNGEFIGYFLDIKDLYSLASFIKNFETINFNKLSKQAEEDKQKESNTLGYENWVPFSEDPIRMLNWYIDKILGIYEQNKNNRIIFEGFDSIFDNRESGVSFINRIDILMSLGNFMNKVSVKEANSPFSVVAILSHVINNSYGANYTVYNNNTGNLTVQEMHSHNATRVDLQNSVYSHLLKDSKKLNKFYIGITVPETGKQPNESEELEAIKKSTDTDQKLSTFIFNTLGIYLAPEGAAALRTKIGNDQIPSYVRAYLKAIRVSEKNKPNLLDKIISNEEAITNRELENVQTYSDVISDLSSEIQDILDIYLDNYVLRPIMNATTLSGEKIPTFKLANLMYDDISVLTSRKKIEDSKSTNFRSLFLKEGGLLGTATKLEAIKKDENKKAFDWNVAESFASSFNFDFLNVFMPKSKTKGINITIGNYSDKNSILAKIIDKNISLDSKKIIGDTVGKTAMSVTDIIDLVRTQTNNFYKDVLLNIFDQYKLLGVKGLGKDIDKNVKIINEYLNEFNSKPNPEQAFLLEVNSKHRENNNIKITQELHYSFYNGKKLFLNQLIIDNYKISEDEKLFDTLVEKSEQSLLNKLKEEQPFLLNAEQWKKIDSEDNRKVKNKSNLSYIAETFNIDQQALSKFMSEDQMLLEKDGKINPLLKRWLWINNLFRNEYLFITIKPEYMHPHKLKADVLQARAGKKFDDNYWSDYEKEISARLPNMSKRNVSFTATYEVPIRNYRLGVPENVNIAVISDHTSDLYNVTGNRHTQDVHDGSSVMSYAYSKMVENSFPGKGYRGTKKQIGTFVTEFGSALKKDAEIVLTNNRIRDSLTSIVSLRDKQQQMLSAKELPNINISKKTLPLGFAGYYDNGDYYKIRQYEITNNVLTLSLAKYNPDTQSFSERVTKEVQVKTLFDIWEAFGGEFSIDQELNFSESSNELLYDLITSFNENNNYLLKENFIHVISNGGSFKSGGTNINPRDFWKTNDKLAYNTYENRYMGPQLDANHTADQSKIKEITQIISALAQNPTTAYMAEEVYSDIARIIESSAKPYVNITESKNLSRKAINDFYQVLSRKFAFNLANSDGINLANTIAETFGQTELLPFSNQHFFRAFVEDMITKMNSEFITRYYPGIGAILNPSHNMIQIYEDKNGNIYKQEELSKEAFDWYSTVKNDPSVVEYVNSFGNNTQQNIIRAYINQKFENSEVTVSEINPGDVVIVDETQELDLSDIDVYYNFKQRFSPEDIITKIHIRPRDLKPSQITWTQEVIKKDKPSIFLSKNIFDSDSVRLRFAYNRLLENKGKFKGSGISEKDYNTLVAFAKHFELDLNSKIKMTNYLNAWTQRNLQLLDFGRAMKSIDDIEVQYGSIDFKKLFGNDKLYNKSFSNSSQYYQDGVNTTQISNYQNKPAELILPNIYKSSFDTGNDAIHKITGPEYFKQKLELEYKSDTQDADLKFNIKNGHATVYVKYVNTLPPEPEDPKLFVGTYDEELNKTTKVRISVDGKPLYSVPENAKVKHINGYDIIFLKASDNKLVSIKNEETGEIKEERRHIIRNDIESRLQELISSFKGEISSIVPIMNNKNDKLVFKLKNEQGENVYLNELSFKMFRNYANFIEKKTTKLDNTWMDNNRDLVLTSLSNKMYASWQKSLEFVAARIPAQSMQSFMEMRNIGYFNTESNDAYVSIWQIWLQGSDFDIDKAYIMGYGFNKNGQYELPSKLFDYSSKERLDALEKLPLPNGENTELQINNPTFNAEVLNIIDLIPEGTFRTKEVFSKFNNLDIINFGILLRKLSKNNNKLEISKELNNSQTKKIQNLVNILKVYNTDKTYIYNKNSIRNSIVSKIKQIISTPSNLILASQPVSIRDIHDAATKSKEVLGFEEEVLNPFDVVSFFQQQKNASVGKANVGIGANGLKVFFALSNYYNSWHNQNKLSSLKETEIYTNPKLFKKTFIINGKIRNIHSIANVDINEQVYNDLLNKYGYDDLQKQYSELSDQQAALLASGFVSAATDNAKELVLAKINAIVELSAMHIYLISLGYSMNDIAIYMNSDLGKYVAKNISGNIFLSADKVYLKTLVENYKKDSGDVIIEEEKRQFLEIYEGAQEFKILASILKVNQKATANVLELNKFLSTLESAVYARENAVLGKSLINLRNSDKWLESTKEGSLVENIIKNNDLLSDWASKDLIGAQTHVVNILTKASNISVKYIDENKETKEKVVSLVGGQFDFRYYLHPENEAYREATIEYYNLFKNTINLFDVIENSPHFKAMVNGVSTIHNVLSIVSSKYYWVMSKVRDLVRTNTDDIQQANSDELKSRFGNNAFSIDITDQIIARGLVTFDQFMIFSWLNSKGNIDNFRFSAKEMLKLAGVSSLDFYGDPKIKSHNVGEIKKNSALVKDSLITITTEDSSRDLIIDLKSELGIANFKILMEEVILTILQKNKVPLGNNLKLTAVKNFMGLFTNQITPTFGISSINSPISNDKLQELLGNFNEVDQVAPEKIRNPEGKWLPYKDLFYIYNLIVNNEKYGDKRLTPLFEDYIKNEGTIGRDFLTFSTSLDTEGINIFDVDVEGTNEEEIKLKQELKENMDKYLLFLLLHKKGQLKVEKSGSRVSINNANFPIIISVNLSTQNNSIRYLAAKSILSILRNRNLIINFNCD